MAIVKFSNAKADKNNNSGRKLKRAINYITNSKKTRPELIGGIGVDKDNSFERMETVKRFYNKTHGREYKSFVVSFKGERFEDVVYEAAKYISRYFSDYQVLYAVHINTENTHIHFIVNSVCVSDGHKLSQSKSDLQDFKDYVADAVSIFGLDDDFTLYGYTEDNYSDDTYEYYCEEYEDEYDEELEDLRRQYREKCALPWHDGNRRQIFNSGIYSKDKLKKLISGELIEPIVFYELCPNLGKDDNYNDILYKKYQERNDLK